LKGFPAVHAYNQHTTPAMHMLDKLIQITVSKKRHEYVIFFVLEVPVPWGWGYSLYREAPHEMGAFFKLTVY